jgi:hypothetical protein
MGMTSFGSSNSGFSIILAPLRETCFPIILQERKERPVSWAVSRLLNPPAYSRWLPSVQRSLAPPVFIAAKGYNREMVKESTEQVAVETIELKEPALAAFLAWLIPGLGHWYQGRRAKAALYFVCIMGLFAYGLYLGGSSTLGYGRAVYFSWRPGDERLAYLCQIGVGLPALPALVQANRMDNNRKVWCGGFMAPPRLSDREGPNVDQPKPGDLHRQLHHYFELAGFFTMVAGLLNVLAIYDACAGPVVVRPDAKKEQEGSGD